MSEVDEAPRPGPAFLRGGGQTGALIAAHDWSATPLGRIDGWPPCLRTAVSIVLRSPVPIVMLWGGDGIMLYNDGYSVFAGARHPRLLGSKVREGWPEVADFNDHVMRVGLAGGTLTYRDQELTLYRHGRPERVSMDLNYSPVLDDSGVPAGVICVLADTTERVAADRRLRSERERQRVMLRQMPGFAALLTGPEHRFDYVNDAYVAISGDRAFVGRTVREVFPELAGQGFYERLDAVFATGEGFAARALPIALDRPDGSRFIDLVYEPIRADDGTMAGIFVGGYDVTERVHAERRRDALLRLDGRLRAIAEPAELALASARLLGEALVACRVGYGDVDPDAGKITVAGAWRLPGLPDVAGVYDFADFGTYLDALRSGHPVMVADVEADPRTVDRATVFRAFGIRAFLDAPVVEGGRTVAEVFVHSAVPRDWTEQDVELAHEFAERTRAAIARRKAEAELRDSEQRYRTLFETIDEGFCVVEFFDGPHGPLSDYVHVEANPAYERHAGFHDIVGKTVRAMLRDDEADGWVASIRRVLVDGRPVRFERELVATNRYLEVACFRIEPAGRRQVAILFQDVTARKRAELALRESEAQFRLMADAVPQIVWITDRAGRTEFFNRQFADYTGEQVRSSSPHEIAATHMHPDDGPAVVARFAAALASGEPFQVEHRIRSATGEHRWFLAKAVPYRDPGSAEITRWFGASVDIHDRKMAEARLREMNETLERRVAERTAELMHAEEALRQSQKMEAVGQLTGGIAHDFNNLLTGVIGSLDLMQRRIARGDTGMLERYATAAMTSANRAAALTHRLLAFSRRQPLDPKPVNANRLVTGMEDLLRRTIGETVRLKIVTAGALWQTLCDAHQLESAILNLAINARDAMPDGGSLAIETCNAHLDDVSAARRRDLAPGQYICICVTDDGTGMAPDVVSKAFDPFFTTKPIGQGTGLGLSMIYGFARQSEGYVKIFSELGQGTTVKLYLPRYFGEADDDDHEPGERALEHRSRDGEVVLVVEDETTVRELVVDVLEELGYRVAQAADGPAGLRLLQSDMRIDLLVTDVGLPGLNGRQLADAARQQRPGLKVLFMTGYAENAAVPHGFLEAGMELVTKPFAIEALVTRIRALIGADGSAAAAA